MSSQTHEIVVIIPAYEAEQTIGRAVQSALAVENVAEVFVIDDASSDQTASEAEAAGDGDPRLNVLRHDCNKGPSAARNLAISESTSPIISILDADDFFLPGRFAPILTQEDWDICADNLVFFDQSDDLQVFLEQSARDPVFEGARTLSFASFVRGNISQKKQIRGELGFLKPLIRREFLERHELHYDENCRLGEDFILYTRALAMGARFKVVGDCGYAAMIRNNSLSSRHCTDDLAALHARTVDLLDTLELSETDRLALASHAQSIHRKAVHRKVLDIRQQQSLMAGILAAAQNPTAITDILSDRLFAPSQPQAIPRFLLHSSSFEEANS